MVPQEHNKAEEFLLLNDSVLVMSQLNDLIICGDAYRGKQSGHKSHKKVS